MMSMTRLASFLCVIALLGIATKGGIAQQDDSHRAKGADTNSASAGNSVHDDGSPVVQQYDSELERLKEFVAGSTDSCRNAIFVAAKDAQVRATLLTKLSDDHYRFMGVRCLEEAGISEQRQVLFDFDCRPGIFCLIDPNVLVIVDVVDGRVVDIIDPYIATAAKTTRGYGSGIHRMGAAHTLADRRIAITNRGLKFLIANEENPTIRVSRGDTVEVSFASSGNHDWTLVYLENGSERIWAMAGPGQTTSFAADRVGEFDYFCSVGTHRQQGMKGKFIVE